MQEAVARVDGDAGWPAHSWRRLRHALGPAWRAVRDSYGGFTYTTALLRKPITTASATATVRAGMRDRASMFLDTLERGVFANGSSPYRPMLDAAGYDLGRVKGLVALEGVEGTLRRLAHDGIYVAVDEYKGLRPARRGAHTFRFGEKDFLNPLIRPGFQVTSGGSRSLGTQTAISLAGHYMNSELIAVAIAALGLEGLPGMVWFPRVDPVSLATVLCLASMRQIPTGWFTQMPGGFSNVFKGQSHSYYLGSRAAARLRGTPLPRPRNAPFGEEFRILPWITEEIGGRKCWILTTPSAALRLALAAKTARVRLANVIFVTGAEALTPAKFAAIKDVGANAVSMFGFTEFGLAGAPCASPASPDDMHLCKSAVATIQRRRSVDRFGSEVDALLFTSLRPDSPRILLNMESGDYAKMTVRRCGCPLEALGWTEHLEDIRSFEKLNLEGRYFFGTLLDALVEETLPARFGGEATDYQLVEHEDREGHTHLSILVHPRLGAIDEQAVMDCLEKALTAPTSWATAQVYRAIGTLQLRREAPMLTLRGKVMSLHHLGPGQVPGAWDLGTPDGQSRSLGAGDPLEPGAAS